MVLLVAALCPRSSFGRTLSSLYILLLSPPPFLFAVTFLSHSAREDKDKRNRDGVDLDLGNFESGSRILEFRKFWVRFGDEMFGEKWVKVRLWLVKDKNYASIGSTHNLGGSSD